MSSEGEDYNENQAAPADGEEKPMAEQNHVKRILDTIRQDKEHFKKDFDQMREDMYVARHGRLKEYPDEHYKANIAGRHVKQKTAALYAKNPKATARRRETMDFLVWDENPESLQMAMQTIQAAQQMLMQVGGAQPVDPMTGEAAPMEIPPEMEQAFLAAQEIVADFQQGQQKRDMVKKISRTLEILFAQALREQKPVEFKVGAKQLVRRALTTGVGYVELGFQREMGPRPGMNEALADARTRLDHLKSLAERAAKGEAEGGLAPDSAEISELEKSAAALMAEPEIVLREGLIFDFPPSTKVIPDRLCKSLVGFIGARHLTIEYMFTTDQVKEIFGKDLGKGYKGYTFDGKTAEHSAMTVEEDSDGFSTLTDAQAGSGLVCVWKHYDKPSGLVYYVADGCREFLREPSAPDVFVEDFWPVYALTFNAVESENRIFPPSDVRLILDMQMEYNRSRQGMREHRKAARPRWVYRRGAVEDGDIAKIGSSEPFDAIPYNPAEPGLKIADVFETVPVPGVDPNLYETSQLFTDVQLVVGSAEAQFGAVSKATATESAIAANSTQSSDQASIDDLDAFLTVISRAGGQILLREMSEDQVKQIAGPGAVWPHMTLAEIAGEVYLEVEAGSTGKPNQAVEINNWKFMLPFLLQMPGMNPSWILKETLRRLDDRMDLTEAIAAGTPSIMAQNKLDQITQGPPAADPNAQGDQGADNAPKQTESAAGSDAAFGSNQV